MLGWEEEGAAALTARDPTQFTDANLSRFDSVMFVSTSEEVLDTTQQGALERYFKSGGIYTGVHSASACLYNSEAYLNAVGGESNSGGGVSKERDVLSLL